LSNLFAAAATFCDTRKQIRESFGSADFAEKIWRSSLAMFNQRRFLTIEECAVEARISLSSLRHWLRVGKLKSIRPGRRRLIERIEFEAFLRRSATKFYRPDGRRR
jgi:excisionase family DNA binding protein